MPFSRRRDLKGDGSISTVLWQNSKAAWAHLYPSGTAHFQVTLLASKHICAAAMQNGLSMGFFLGTGGSYHLNLQIQ